MKTHEGYASTEEKEHKLFILLPPNIKRLFILISIS